MIPVKNTATQINSSRSSSTTDIPHSPRPLRETVRHPTCACFRLQLPIGWASTKHQQSGEMKMAPAIEGRGQSPAIEGRGQLAERYRFPLYIQLMDTRYLVVTGGACYSPPNICSWKPMRCSLAVLMPTAKATAATKV